MRRTVAFRDNCIRRGEEYCDVCEANRDSTNGLEFSP